MTGAAVHALEHPGKGNGSGSGPAPTPQAERPT
jgi:hypothetical protein